MIKSRLINRFGVPKSQIAVFENEERVRLEQEIPNHLARASKDCEFYVYVATKGYADKGPNDDVATAFLAAKDSVRSRIDSTGVRLEWLIDELDNAVCSRKILMLDCWNDEGVVSAAEMVELVQSNKRGGYPRTAYVLANCSPSQRATEMSPSQTDGAKHGLFGYQIAQAFSGKADLEMDSKVEITELTDFIIENVSSLAKTNAQSQTPVLFVPDNRPPRLSDSGKRGIIDMLSKFGIRMAKEDILIEAMKVNDLVNNQPEPMLACGLLLIKQGKTREAFETLENVRLAHVDHIVTQQAVIWVHFNRKHYRQGCELLAGMLTRIPLPEGVADYDEATYKKFEWAGRLRELAVVARPWIKSDRLPTAAILEACDEAIKAHGAKAMEQYQAGRKRTRLKGEAFALQLKKDAASSASLERERLKSYVPSIASLETIAEIRAGLDLE